LILLPNTSLPARSSRWVPPRRAMAVRRPMRAHPRGRALIAVLVLDAAPGFSRLQPGVPQNQPSAFIRESTSHRCCHHDYRDACLRCSVSIEKPGQSIIGMSAMRANDGCQVHVASARRSPIL
jgi:hypothetical protein